MNLPPLMELQRAGTEWSIPQLPNEYTIPEKQESIHVGYEPPTTQGAPGAGTEWSIPQLYTKWVHYDYKKRKHSCRVWTSHPSWSSRVQRLRGPSLNSIPNEYTMPTKQESIHVGDEPPTPQGTPGCRDWEVHPSTLYQMSTLCLQNKKAFM